MYRAISAFGLAGIILMVVGGCPLNQLVPDGNQVTGTVGDVTRPRVIPPLPSALITVEIVNETGFPARIDVRLELAGNLVRQAVRTISADRSPILIGIDRADLVQLRASIFAGDEIVLPDDTRRLQRDFQDGEIVRFVLRLGVENDCNENGIDDATEPDADGDGVIDACDGCPNDAEKIAPGDCGCGVADVDTDEDGTPDCNDDCPEDSAKVAPGACGCGVSDQDRDEDGTPDCDDGCPDDPAKIVPGACGCGVPDVDENENGIIDCVEVDDIFVDVVDLDENIRVGQADSVEFRVLLQNLEAADNLRVLLTRISGNSSAITLFEGTSNPDVRVISFPIEGIAPGRYRVSALVERDETVVATDEAAGQILVNNPPTIEITQPASSLLLRRGETTTILFTAFDRDDNARIRLLLDTDLELDGEELTLIEDIEENVTESHSFEFDPDALKLPDGEYFIAAVIEDPVDSAFAYSAKICVTSRRLGSIETDALPGSQRHFLRGSVPNFQFGFAVDMSRDMDQDGRADLLVGDPRFVRIDDDKEFDLGAAQLFLTTSEESGTFRFPATASRADTTFFGEFTLQRAGSRVAMIDSVNGDDVAEFLIGVPFYSFGTGALMGRGYLADGAYAITRKFFFLCCETFPRVASYEGEFEDMAGKDVAGLRDVGGDQIPDFAIGAAHPGGIGVVTVLRGGPFLTSGRLANRGYQIFGSQVDGQFGCEIESCPDLDGDGRAEIAIGEPGPLSGEYEPAGCVYLVYGDARFNDNDDALLGKNPLRIRKFIGASSNDGFGHAIQCADFDCDGKIDLMVGAPGANGGAGAVYIIYDVGNANLPEVVSVADIGTELLPGARIDGRESGDQFGFVLTTASDFDGDTKADLIVGAPGTASRRGSAWFVYGGIRPSGTYSLETDTCEFQAFELFPSIATAEGGGTVPRAQQFGFALSTGDTTNNGRADIAIGSPGFNNRGAVYIIDATLATDDPR